MDHMTSDTVEHIRCMLPGDTLLCIGCAAIAWGAAWLALL